MERAVVAKALATGCGLVVSSSIPVCFLVSHSASFVSTHRGRLRLRIEARTEAVGRLRVDEGVTGTRPVRWQRTVRFPNVGSREGSIHVGGKLGWVLAPVPGARGFWGWIQGCRGAPPLATFCEPIRVRERRLFCEAFGLGKAHGCSGNHSGSGKPGGCSAIRRSDHDLAQLTSAMVLAYIPRRTGPI